MLLKNHFLSDVVCVVGVVGVIGMNDKQVVFGVDGLIANVIGVDR